MKNHKKILAIVLPAALLLPIFVFAAGLIPCDNTNASNACGFDDLIKLINNIIDLFLRVAVFIAAFTFAFAGATILLHPGDTTQRSKAISMFKKTIIGMLIVLLSWTVIHFVILALVGKDDPNNALRFLAK